MSEVLMHEPILVIDEDVQTTIVKCSVCGKILWFPESDEECIPPPPTLKINVSDGVGAVDVFGR